MTNSNWKTETSMTVNGRHVEPGTEVTIEGAGRCRFHSRTNTGQAEWITVFDRHGQWRSFDPDRVRTVHRTTKTR